jgi:exo-beta-1,3-glucanase (GH17 family)
MQRLLPLLILAWLATLPVASGAAQPACARSASVAPALERLRTALAQARFITYEPTSLEVRDGHVREAEAESIRADLALLRPRFDGLITYDAVHGAQQIAPIAAQLKFRALIIGVWNPLDPAQIAAALATARSYPQLVAGISLGNETLFSHRAEVAQLAAAFAAVRARAPQLPLSTTEPFHIFEAAPGITLLPLMDFMLVNVHPVFQSWFHRSTDATAAQFVVNVAGQLAHGYCGPILIKETGMPTAPAEAGYSDQRQASFYKELRVRLPPHPLVAFSYFSAFDAPWRVQDATGVPGPHPEEAYWGLYDSARRPKPAVDQLAPLAQDPRSGN